MSTALVQAHITAQQRLRALARRGVEVIWRDLGSYDQADLGRWLARVLPLVDAAQRQGAALTGAYIARALGRRPIGLDVKLLTGAAVRNGAAPAEVYRRPLVGLWADLKDGKPYDAAVAAGMARAAMTAATDVQLTQRAVLGAVQAADPQIVGYRREIDGGACPFCSALQGAFSRDGGAGSLHPGCGCSWTPVVGSVPPPEALPEDVAVETHGELGPVLGSANHAFTGPADI
jgi:hypothetical protein